MSFTTDFVWGAASASYQIEGAWNEDGKGESIWDVFSHAPGNITNGDHGDIACDAYHRLEEDVRLMKEIGLDAYRFSISWPRIFPCGEGDINPSGLAYYDRLIDLLLANGITPYLTLFHWDLPQALAAKGGWLNRDIAIHFATYAATIAKHFDGRVKHYFTLNEPQCFILLGYGNGIHAPGLRLPIAYQLQGMHHALLAHGMAVQAIRANSTSPVFIGCASTGDLCFPQEETSAGILAAQKACFTIREENWGFIHHWFLDAAILGRYPTDGAPQALIEFAHTIDPKDFSIIQQPLDFVGLNIYHGHEVDLSGTPIPKYTGYPRTALKWPITPKVLRYGTAAIYDRYQLPIYITENGLSCNDKIYLDGKVHDLDRIDFLSQYLNQLALSCSDGTPISGYFHWSLTDNFEWNSGYCDRFGLIYIDYPTQQRLLKDSAYWYQQYIQATKSARLPLG